MEELIVSWNINMVLLSFGVSFIGSYIGVSLCEQYRMASTNPYRELDYSLHPTIILIIKSISIGGVAVWCMHFVGMNAISLKTDFGYKVEIGYNIGLTVASIFIVVIFVFIGLLIASKDRAYTKTKEEILDMIVDDAKTSGIKISSKFWITLLASVKGIDRIIIGGLVTAGGVCTMHYLGMMSMRFNGHMEWDIGIIAASVAIAFMVCAIAFWIMFRLLALYPYLEWLRVASAMVMGVAVNAMHYTGMYGAKYQYDPTVQINMENPEVVSTEMAFGAALLLGFLAAWVIFILIIRDMRQWNQYCEFVIRKTDHIFAEAVQNPTSPVECFLEKYKDARGISYEFLSNFNAISHDVESSPHKEPLRRTGSGVNMASMLGSSKKMSVHPEMKHSKKISITEKLPTGPPKKSTKTPISSASVAAFKATKKAISSLPPLLSPRPSADQCSGQTK